LATEEQLVKARRRYPVAALLLLNHSLGAAEFTARITDARGAPIADAVVTIVPHGGAAAATLDGNAETKVVDQRNEAFIPYVEIFRPGDNVVFHNSDHTRHHVYSFAPARQFEFVLTPGQSSLPLRLEHAGIVAVGCNIHDRMITYLYISDAAWIGRTTDEGRVTIDSITPGDFDVHVWHPQLRPGRPDPVQPLHVADSGDRKDLAFSLSLLPDPRSPRDRERTDY
jgi:plastocyanin